MDDSSSDRHRFRNRNSRIYGEEMANLGIVIGVLVVLFALGGLNVVQSAANPLLNGSIDLSIDAVVYGITQWFKQDITVPAIAVVLAIAVIVMMG